MENYMWLAVGAGISLVIFIAWAWRGRKGKGNDWLPGRDEPAGLMVETEAAPNIGGERLST